MSGSLEPLLVAYGLPALFVMLLTIVSFLRSVVQIIGWLTSSLAIRLRHEASPFPVWRRFSPAVAPR